MTLEQFTQELKSDSLWVEAMRAPSRFKSLDAAIEKVYGQVISDGSLKLKPITEHRKHVFNTLGTQKFGEVKTGVQLQQAPSKEEKKEETVIESCDYETQQRRLKEWLDSIASVPDIKKVPKLTSKEIQEEGQWDKKKHPIYKPDPNQILIHEYKLEYSRTFSDPYILDGRLIPGAPKFEDWMQEKLYGGKHIVD